MGTFSLLEFAVSVLDVDFAASCQFLRPLDGFGLGWENCARPFGVRFFHGPFIALLYYENVFMFVVRHKTTG
jgi:hypothetical protein